MKYVSFILLFVSLKILAAPRFEVEIILFARNVAPESVRENWQVQGKRPDFTKAQSLLPVSNIPYPITVSPMDVDKSELPRGVTLLPQSSMQLNRAFERIYSNGEFTPLLHMSWQQPVYAKRRAQIWRIVAGPNLCPDTASSFASSDLESTMEPQPTLAPCWKLDGTLRIYLLRYLYIDADLQLRNMADESDLTEQNQMRTTTNALPNDSSGISLFAQDENQDSPLNQIKNAEPSPNGSGSWLLYYPMQQSARVRSGEIHYFDHPLYGLIIQIRKLVTIK